jgi:UDP-sulfoquinovose synthase
MRILILGADGYLGWPTAMHFSSRGDEVHLVDNLAKRYWEAEVGVEPLMPIPSFQARIDRWAEETGKTMPYSIGDIAENHRFTYDIFDKVKPDAVIHYAEQPSAPYSMLDRNACLATQRNNVLGTLNVMFAMQHACPDAHLVKLGTMGEYGTPNIDIEEGWLEVEHNGRKDRVLYPKKPGSFYHLSKVHDSNNLEFGCRIWDMRVTDLNQGVVYGIDTDQTGLHDDLATSFHYDAVFGTVINRFVVQAVLGQPLTVYGAGTQTRAFLNIRDTLKCVELAVRNPADAGEFRVFNQFTEDFSILDLAEKVRAAGTARGLDVAIENLENPRIEQEDHYYNAKHSKLADLGLDPILLDGAVIDHMLDVAMRHKDNVHDDQIRPQVRWRHAGLHRDE